MTPAFKDGIEAFKSPGRRYSADTRARLASGLWSDHPDDVDFRNGYESERRRHFFDLDEADECLDAV